MDADARQKLHRADKILYCSGRSTAQALEQIRAEVEPSPEIENLCDFIASTKRGIC